MGELSAHGVAVDVPPGWDGRIARRPQDGEVTTSSADGPPAEPGFTTRTVAHVSTRPLAANAADFGSDVVDELGPDDAMVALVEFEPASADTALFRARGVPRSLDPERFSPNALQRTLPGQAGTQVFFSEGNRAFCLYVVLGSYQRRHDLVPRVNALLETVRIGPSDGAPA